MPRVGGQIGDSCFRYIAGEPLLDIGDAGVYVLNLALSEHFNRPVRQITHVTC